MTRASADSMTRAKLELLAEMERERLARLGYSNVEVRLAGDILGWPDGAPYDGIVVTAAAPEVSWALLEQLATGGRVGLPVGGRGGQEVGGVGETPGGGAGHK